MSAVRADAGRGTPTHRAVQRDVAAHDYRSGAGHARACQRHAVG